jgi:hypothetical protein
MIGFGTTSGTFNNDPKKFKLQCKESSTSTDWVTFYGEQEVCCLFLLQNLKKYHLMYKLIVISNQCLYNIFYVLAYRFGTPVISMIGIITIYQNHNYVSSFESLLQKQLVGII